MHNKHYSYSLSKYLLCAYHVPDNLLGFRLSKNNKTESNLTGTLLCILSHVDVVQIVHLCSNVTNE